jgi:translation initiation factor 2 alpha subunit (eIF-2alpha)
VQKNAIKSLVKLWSLFQGGVEEIKERFKDAEAEIKTEAQPDK